MKQQDRGSYRKKDSLVTEFRHSCLGRIIITAVILAILAVIAWMTKPSEQVMYDEMIDNIRECIEANDSINTDWIDDAVNNVGYIFTSADSTVNEDIMNAFFEYNRLEYNDHTLFATMRLYNNFRIQGVRCGYGIFGIVIPTVNFNDFLLRVGTMRKDYNQSIIRQTYGDDDYMGENPDLGGAFQYNPDAD